MAYNEKLAAVIKAELGHLPDVKEKKMFGGLAFMVNGKMCITIGKDRIMCRINPVIHEELICKEGIGPVIMRGREYKGYIHVHEDVIKTKKERLYWINLALDYNKIAKSSRKN